MHAPVSSAHSEASQDANASTGNESLQTQSNFLHCDASVQLPAVPPAPPELVPPALVPPALVPRNTDGEVSEFRLLPIGAVIVHEKRVIARSWNLVETLKDATAHAEMQALTQAQSEMGDWRLTDCDLYVTKEPCPMCAGAIVHCRVRRGGFCGASCSCEFSPLRHTIR